MTYIENIFLCMASPLLVAALCMGRRQLRLFLLSIAGMGVCPVSYTHLFLLYNCLHVGYWIASACNYLVGGTMSYFLNRKYTFHSHDNRLRLLAKYVLHMVVCSFVSYSLAPVVTTFVLDHWTLHAKGNVSLAVGSVTFTILNYFGPRYVVFRSFHQTQA